MTRTSSQTPLPNQPVRVLVVDDSPVARMILVHTLEADPRIRVIGAVEDGEAAVEFVQRQPPDLVLMDIQMPRMDGFEATRRIMETRPVPIVVCSGTANPKEVATTFRVLEAGALACVEKPLGLDHPGYPEAAAALRQMVTTMSEVRVVRRWRRPAAPRGNGGTPPQPVVSRGTGIRVVGVGASTGGPQAVQQILASLPKTFPVPILIVQHIAPGFLGGLATWLNDTTGFQVHIAAHGLPPLPGHVYLAPDDFHMGVTRSGRIQLTKESPEHHLRPAVSHLFRSLAAVYGPAAIGVLLTGMGRDGAEELKLMKDHGAVTIAQDAQSAVVFGMPGEAVRLGAATHVLPPDRIADGLVATIEQRNQPGGNE